MTPDQWRATHGERIERARLARHLSVREAAKRAGVSEGLWRQIESGRRQLAKDVVRTVSPKPGTLAAVLGVVGLAGDQPAPLTQPAGDPLAALQGRVDRLEADLREALELLVALARDETPPHGAARKVGR